MIITGASVFGQGNCVPSPSGIVGWWPGNGNSADAAGNDGGRLGNGVSFVVDEVGQAFYFNSNSAAVLIGKPATLQLQNFTIEAWIRRGSTTAVTTDPTASAGDGVIFGYGHLG